MESEQFWSQSEIVQQFANRQTSGYITNTIDEIHKNIDIKLALDLGCGGGRYTKYLKQIGINDVLAVDKNVGMVEYVKTLAIEAKQCSFDNIKSEDNQFDLILCIGVLHNAEVVEELTKGISEISRVSAYGAFVLVSIFTNDIIDKDLTKMAENLYAVDGKPSMTLLDKSGLVKLFKKNFLYLYKEVDEHITDVGTGKRNIYTILLRKGIANETFLNDYLIHKSYKIDMSTSGARLSRLPRFINLKKLIDRYTPDKLISEVSNKIKTKEKVTLSMVFGNGSNRIVQNLIRIFFQNGGNLVVPSFSFKQPEYATITMGGIVKKCKCKNNGFIDFQKISNCVDSKTKAVYICNPNNPTGIYESNQKIINLAKRHTSIPIIIDEAAIEISLMPSLCSEKNLPPNIIIVRTFSKSYSLSGLRLGYAFLSEKYYKIYTHNICHNETSNIAINYANKILDTKYLEKNVKEIINQRKKVQTELRKVGIETFPSKSNTLLTIKKIPSRVGALFENNNIFLINTGEDSGNLSRIAIQNKRINKRFINVLRKIKGGLK